MVETIFMLNWASSHALMTFWQAILQKSLLFEAALHGASLRTIWFPSNWSARALFTLVSSKSTEINLWE